MTLKAQQQGHVLRELFCPQTESMAAIWIWISPKSLVLKVWSLVVPLGGMDLWYVLFSEGF
jgi:hypothetical protein